MSASQGGGGEVLEQDGAEPSPLVLVLDEEGHLGVVRAGVPVVATDGDQRVAEEHHEGHPVHVVDVGEPVQVLLGQPLHRPEEAVVARLVAAAVHEADQALGVLRADRPKVHRAAVGGDDVGLPVRRRRRVLARPRFRVPLRACERWGEGGSFLSHGGRPDRARSRGRTRDACA